MSTENIYREEASNILLTILEHYDLEGDYRIWQVKGLYFDEAGNKWVAFDNSTADCWVEEFETEANALRWLKG